MLDFKEWEEAQKRGNDEKIYLPDNDEFCVDLEDVDTSSTKKMRVIPTWSIRKLPIPVRKSREENISLQLNFLEPQWGGCQDEDMRVKDYG